MPNTSEFNLNLGNTTPGSEWSLGAQTLNKVKYPNDVRIPTAGSTKNWFWTTTYIRNVSGKKLMFISDMYGSGLGIYRFNTSTDGETAIPSGLFSGGNPSESIWRDANGNGAVESGETETKNADNYYSTHIFPDANGGVWKANREGGIRYFPLQGFDSNGNPQYTYASSVRYTQNEIADVKRLEYDALNNVLYIAGRSTSSVSDSDWGSLGNSLVRYDNFTGARTTAWSISLPHSTTSPASELNVKALCEAGDYLFLAANRDGRIYVHKKSDGSKVGEILPTSETGSKSGWSDINGAVRAYQGSNGEYLIFAEENGYGKINMYRWNPTPPAGTGLRGEYYSNTNFTTLLKSQIDPTIDFSWGSGSPKNLDGTTMSGVGHDNFAVRWTGRIQAIETGTYTISVVADDTAKVWISDLSGTPVVNQTAYNSGLPTHGTFTMSAGQRYNIKIDFTEVAGGAMMQLKWTRPGTSTSAAVPHTQLYPPLQGIHSFRSIYSLAADGSEDLLTPAGDGVANLLKYAFNMLGTGTAPSTALSTPNASVLSANGSAGLPLIGWGSGEEVGKLKITYVRRKASMDPGVTYTVMFSNTLASGSWAVNASAVESVTLIDSIIERVTVTDSAITSGKRFIRVRVASNP